MVKISFQQKPFRKIMMNTFGGDCVASPSHETAAGRAILAEDPESTGSLGIAISEAVEAAVTDPTGGTRYTLGSVLNHVLLHQTIIGLEAKKQLAALGERKVDQVIACVGGGSNFAGIAFPFVQDKINGADIDIIAVEPASCPTLTRGPYVYDHGDVARMTPLMAMHSLGHTFMPPGIHAGGLRYHGMAPLVSQTVLEGLTRAVSLQQLECFEAALLFARTEGIIPAPGIQPRHRPGHPGSRAGPGGGQGTGDPVQPQRPRPHGPGRLQRLHGRPAGQPRALRGGPGQGAGLPGRPAQARAAGHDLMQ